jgi:uncharacterized protein
MRAPSTRHITNLLRIHIAFLFVGSAPTITALVSNSTQRTKRILMVMAKAPVRGQNKTRLGNLIGMEAATDFYRCLLADVLDIVRDIVRATPDMTPAIAYTPIGSEAMFREIAPDFELVLQQGELLGDRLHHVLHHALTHGYNQAAVLSADTPFVEPATLAHGFAALSDGADVSIGPCEDGGWYVMHLHTPHPELLVPITMSTPQTYQDTLAAARHANLHVEVLPATTDVDTPDDLTKILQTSAKLPAQVARHTRGWLTQWQQAQQTQHLRST